MTTNLTGVFDMPQDPGEADLLRMVQRETQLEVRTSTIGKVISFDPSNCTAKVSVEIPTIVKDPLNPSKQITKPPIILARMPVYFPRTPNGAILTFPILPGQTGEIHVQDRNPAQWLASGAYTDPLLRATHWLSFGIFYPGLCTTPTTQQHGPVDLTATVLDGDSQVKLGKNAQLGVARMTDKTSADTGMLAWIAQVQAALTTISAIVPVVLPTPPTDFGVISQASTKVKSE